MNFYGKILNNQKGIFDGYGSLTQYTGYKITDLPVRPQIRIRFKILNANFFWKIATNTTFIVSLFISTLITFTLTFNEM